MVARVKLTQYPKLKIISDSRPGRDSVQKALTHELCQQAGVDPSRPSDLSDAKKKKKIKESLKYSQTVIL